MLNIFLIPGKWHKYDRQIQTQLESSFLSGASKCDIDINGMTYEFDFRTHMQVLTKNRTGSRNIRRGSAEPRQNVYANMFPVTSTNTAPDDILGRGLFRPTSGHLADSDFALGFFHILILLGFDLMSSIGYIRDTVIIFI